jgi:hypothetical protein
VALMFAHFNDQFKLSHNTRDSIDKVSMTNDVVQNASSVKTLASQEGQLRLVMNTGSLKSMSKFQHRTKEVFENIFKRAPKEVLAKELVIPSYEVQTLSQSDFSKYDTTITRFDNFMLLVIYFALCDDLLQFMPLAESTINT